MSTITAKEQAKIAAFLATHSLPAGVGSEESACSIAAINLALTGELTDEIPACMSPVIGQWIIRVQDAMPDDMRNSAQWKNLLPLAAGTGRATDDERRRLALVLDWMWGGVLPHLQSVADKYGFGESWRTMCGERTYAAAVAVAAVARAAVARADAYTAYTAYATYADAATYAAAYAAAARAATYADAARAAARAATYAADAYAATAVADADAAYAAAWTHFNPCALLARLVEV